MQCRVNTDPTICVTQAHPGETFVLAHPQVQGVVLARARIDPTHGAALALRAAHAAAVCVVIASQQPEYLTGTLLFVHDEARVISVAPRQIPEFVALEG